MKIRGSALIIKFLATLFIARYLGLEELGFYGLVTAATIIIPLLLGLGLAYTISRKAVTASLEEVVSDLKNFGKFFFFIYLIPASLSVAYGVSINQLTLYVLVLIVICFEHVNGFSYQLLQNISRPVSANFNHFIRSSAWLILYMPLAYLYPQLRDIGWLMLFWAFGSLLAFCHFFYLVKDWPWKSSLTQTRLLPWIKKEFYNSYRAYLIGVFESVGMYLDRYMIGLFLGLEMVGVYVFFWQITSAMNNLLSTGVVQVTRPKLVKAFKDKSETYEKVYIKCLQSAVLGALLASFTSVVGLFLLLPYMQRPLVEQYFPIYYLMLLAFMGSVIKEVQKLKFYSQHRDDITLKVSFVTLLSSCIFTSILVVSSGVWGAGVAMTLVALSSVLVQAYEAKKLKAVTHL